MPEKFPASGFGEVREQQAPDALTELRTPVSDTLLHLRIAIPVPVHHLDGCDQLAVMPAVQFSAQLTAPLQGTQGFRPQSPVGPHQILLALEHLLPQLLIQAVPPEQTAALGRDLGKPLQHGINFRQCAGNIRRTADLLIDLIQYRQHDPFLAPIVVGQIAHTDSGPVCNVPHGHFIIAIQSEQLFGTDQDLLYLIFFCH